MPLVRTGRPDRVGTFARLAPFAVAALLLSAVAGPLPSARAADDRPWDQILAPRPAPLPPPRTPLDVSISVLTHRQTSARTSVRWEADLPEALAAARREGRPLFVTMRCLPCKSCSEFDKTVLEGGPDLDPLFRQFVTVRLTSTKGVDLRLLPMADFQDMDVSWWSWFLSPEGRVYGVFGGRDKAGDQTRTSKSALVATMRRVLDHHYDARRPTWDVDGPAPQTAGAPRTPVDLPGFKSWLGVRENARHFKEHNCIHCHQTAEIMRQGQMDLGQFDKRRDLQVWPYPENVGLTLDLDDGLRVTDVAADSPAAKAGLKPGDVLGAAGGRRVFGQADFRGVLHRAPLTGPAAVDVRWLRDGAVRSGTLALQDGWRRTDLSWRTSVADGNVGAWPGFWPNEAGPARDRLGLPKDRMAVNPFLGFNKSAGPGHDAGLKPDDVITAVNGESPNLANREWNTWFRMRFEPGDEVRLTVKRPDGSEREVRYRVAR